jgi:hypothetical protein
MRLIVRSIQVCLLLVFLIEASLAIAGIGAMAVRSTIVTDLAPSALQIVQTKLATITAVARFFAASQRLAVVVLLEVVWLFYARITFNDRHQGNGI